MLGKATPAIGHKFTLCKLFGDVPTMSLDPTSCIFTTATCGSLEIASIQLGVSYNLLSLLGIHVGHLNTNKAAEDGPTARVSKGSDKAKKDLS